jgi:phenylacetate-coenzyme A ligase PaaK-like adenylate-forming protein
MLSDYALGYTRWSGYHLRQDQLRQAGDALVKSRARYIVGYSTALDRFARANLARTDAFRRMNLCAVIATAEALPRPDSRDVIASCLGAPVFMEYGSVETGPIAYETPKGGYSVFWPHHRLELGNATESGARELLVTSLFPRALPLLRYAIGDYVLPKHAQDTCIAFEGVVGRCNDVIALQGGAQIHSEAFTHAIRDIEGIRGFQIVRRKGGAPPHIRLEADAPVGEDAQVRVRQRLSLVSASLSAVTFETVPEIRATVAGKRAMVVEEP